MLIFYYDKGQQSTRKKLAIINNYGEDFEIESTSSKIGNIKVLNQKKIDSGYEFDLEITLPDESVEQFTDVFTVNVKGGEKRAVACRGIYRAPKPDKSGE